MSTPHDLTEGVVIQPFVQMATNAKGPKACSAVIQQALNAPNLFVFGELLDLPNVQALEKSDDKKYLDLLKIFGAGTYADYKAQSSNLPQLTPQQIKKLRQLTIATLSYQEKIIPYNVLHQQLEISDVRELEDLIIDSIYQGIIRGKIDQRRKQLEVEQAMSRDLKDDQIDDMISQLGDWLGQSELLLKTIQQRIDHANFITQEQQKHKKEYEKKIETVKSTLKAAMDADVSAAEFEGGEIFEDRARKGRSRFKRQQPRERRM